jgi:DNA polymerase V
MSELQKEDSIPWAGVSIPAGFPSFAEDFISESLDVNELLVPRPNSTFFLRYSGPPRLSDGVMAGDILIVDRSVKPTESSLKVCSFEGQLMLTRKMENEIWGVVTGMARKF